MRLFLSIGGAWLTDGLSPEAGDGRPRGRWQSHGIRRKDGTVVVTHYEDGGEWVAHYDAEGNLLWTDRPGSAEADERR